MPSCLELSVPSFFSFLNVSNKQENAVIKFPEYSFFLSFEDALWKYLEVYPSISKDILIPTFFCSDVSYRLEEKGYTIHYYELDNQLNLILEKFTNLSKQQCFGAVIVYYPMGLRKKTGSISFFRQILGEDCLIIEDCADCILEPNQVALLDKKHIIIDSLRKTLPVQGARLWCTKDIKTLKGKSFSIYRMKSAVLYYKYRMLFLLSNLFDLYKLKSLYWRAFGCHSDLIGTSLEPAKGFYLDEFLLKFIKVDSIKEKKKLLVERFFNRVAQIDLPSEFSFLNVDYDEYKELRFPILIGPKYSLIRLANQLEQDKIYIDTHFEDSLLGCRYDFLLLPLNHKITQAGIDYIVKCIEKRLNNYRL